MVINYYNGGKKMNNGLVYNELKRIEDFLVMANDLQLVQIRLMVSSEIDKRERNNKSIDYVNVLRRGEY